MEAFKQFTSKGCSGSAFSKGSVLQCIISTRLLTVLLLYSILLSLYIHQCTSNTPLSSSLNYLYSEIKDFSFKIMLLMCLLLNK